MYRGAVTTNGLSDSSLFFMPVDDLLAAEPPVEEEQPEHEQQQTASFFAEAEEVRSWGLIALHPLLSLPHPAYPK